MPAEMTGVADPNNGMNGLEKTLESFVDDHLVVSRQLMNFAEGKPEKTPRPSHNPTSRAAQWPVMIYHPIQSPKTIGVSLVGLDEKSADKAEAENKKALDSALAVLGWQKIPYLKPEVRVLSPEEREKQLLDKLTERDQAFAALSDTVQRMEAALGNAAVANNAKEKTK